MDSPKLGTDVLYTLNEGDIETIRQLVPRISSAAGPALNQPSAGEQYPAKIVRCFLGSAAVNLRVFLDGGATAELWATSRVEGTEPGSWQSA